MRAEGATQSTIYITNYDVITVASKVLLRHTDTDATAMVR